MRYNEMTANVQNVRSTVETNKMIRNTYMLLAMTMVFSTVTAAISMAMNLPSFGFLTFFVVLGLFFVINKLQNTVWALPLTFVFTGFLGLSIGPILNHFLGLSNGGEIVLTALGTTAITFFGLSAYVLTSKKDFSFMGSFLIAGLIVLVVSMFALWIMGEFFNIYIPALHMAFSAAAVLLMAGMMLYDTSNIVNGVYTNYVIATVGLYLSIYNMFVNLLVLFGLSGDD